MASRVGAAYLVLFVACPAVARRLPHADRVLIRGSRRQYTVAAVAGSLVLYTLAAVILAGGTGRVGLRVTPDALHLGLLGGAALWVLVCLFTLTASRHTKAQAHALGLERPGDYLVHATWYAFVWAAFREELFYRGLVQGLATSVLPGGWGLLVPLVIFALAHYHNTANPAVAWLWVLSTLPGGLVFGAVYHLSGSLWAPVLAHGLNNAAAGVIGAVSASRPGWTVPATLGLSAAGVAYLAWQWPQLASAAAHAAAALGEGLTARVAPGILAAVLAAGAIFLVEAIRRRWTGRGSIVPTPDGPHLV